MDNEQFTSPQKGLRPTDDLLLSEEGFVLQTPVRKSVESPCSAHSADSECELCSICLSPLRSFSQTRPIIQTSCQHVFHRGCISDMKANCARSECPLCRTMLSPGPAQLQRNSLNNQSYNIRNAVVAAASRGREAVRRAMMMRAMQQQSNDFSSASATLVSTM